MLSKNSREVSASQARQVAVLLRQHPNVVGCEFFGSVARSGSGRDLDFILLVDEGISRAFVDAAKDEINRATRISDALRAIEEFASESLPSHLLSPREKAAICVMGPQLEELIRKAREILGEAVLDLFVLSSDWRNATQELHEQFPQGDATFWENLVREAKPL